MAADPPVPGDASTSCPFEFPTPWEPAALEWEQEILDVFHSPGDSESVKPYCESEASRTLKRELRRYIGRRFQRRENVVDRPRLYGRSILLSGLRGSGKTATAYWVIRDLQRDLIIEKQPIRILPILISASTFLTANRKSEAESSELNAVSLTVVSGGTSSSTKPPEAEPPTPKEDQPQYRLLIEICCSLHRAVIREFLRSLRERLIDEEVAQGSHSSEVRDRFELLTQFQHDIEEFLQPARLREYWRRFGLLSMPRKDHPEDYQSALFRSKFTELPASQAITEVGLLATLNELYLRVVGTVYRESSTQDNTTESNSNGSARATLLNSAEWRTIIAVLLGGSLTGAGTAAAHPDAQVAMTLFAGILGGAVTGWLGSLIPSWTSEKQISRSESFNKDYSLETLHREIPRIIDELFQVGLCPVFLIDELDKVPDLHDQMDDLLGHLKQFFSENGFFCFLTHRQYFDELARQKAVDPYSSTSTWFTERLFVEYWPWEVRRFLQTRIRLLEHTALDPEAGAQVSRDKPLGERLRDRLVWEKSPAALANKDQEKRGIAERDQVILEYVILFRYRQRMSTLGEVHWQFEDWFQSGILDVGGMVTEEYLIEMAFQLAAEIQLRRLSDNGTIRRNQGEIQLVQQVLSLPGRKWKDGKTMPWSLMSGLDQEISLVEAEFRDGIGNSPGAEISSQGDPFSQLLSNPMRLLLEEALQRSAQLLSDPDALFAAAVAVDDRFDVPDEEESDE